MCKHIQYIQCFVFSYYSQESPDENPILDKHPVYSNIVFGAGFSGRSEGTLAIVCPCHCCYTCVDKQHIYRGKLIMQLCPNGIY